MTRSAQRCLWAVLTFCAAASQPLDPNFASPGVEPWPSPSVTAPDGMSQMWWVLPQPGVELRGAFFAFHDCGTPAAAWFRYPEERALALSVLGRGFALVAPQASQACWAEEDVTQFRDAYQHLLQSKDVSRALAKGSLFAVGVGAGGVFAHHALAAGAIPGLSGLHLIASAGDVPRLLADGASRSPPTSFVHMLGETMHGSVKEAAASLRAAGVLTDVQEALPQPLSAAAIAAAADGVDPKAVNAILGALRAKGYVKSGSELCQGDGMPNATKAIFAHAGSGICHDEGAKKSLKDPFLVPFHTEAAWGSLQSACQQGKPLCSDPGVRAAITGTAAAAIFEELKVCEGVRSATHEGFDEALQFLLAHAKPITQPAIPVTPAVTSLQPTAQPIFLGAVKQEPSPAPHSFVNIGQWPSLGFSTTLPPATTSLPPLAKLVEEPTQGFQFHKSIAGDNMWGFPMAASTVTLDSGHVLTYDDVIFGMNRIWEDLGIWTQQYWHGVPFLQNPMDAFAIQELLWAEKPDMVVEIGTHAGGSAVYFGETMRDYNADGLWVTIDPSPMSAAAQLSVASGPLAKNVVFIKGLSNDYNVIAQVKKLAEGRRKVFVIQDGNHATDAVLWDLGFYDPIVTVGGYFIVQDTILDRTNAPTPSAFKAVHTFMSGAGAGRYTVDKRYEHLLFSTNHQGYLRKIAK